MKKQPKARAMTNEQATISLTFVAADWLRGLCYFFFPGQSKSQQWKLIQLGIIFYTQAYLVDEPNLRFPSEWKNKMHFFIYSDCQNQPKTCLFLCALPSSRRIHKSALWAIKNIKLLPSNALSISLYDGKGLFLNNVYIDITIPGVQNPHCDPWDFAIRS